MRYGAHRRQLMGLLASLGRTPAPAPAPAPDICIFGAGNCTDLDPEQLARDHSEIHLVDLDAEALERGRSSFPTRARDRVVLHAGIDLSGFTDRIDDWGERFPDDAEIALAAKEAIAAILRQVGRTFHVVLSDCVLSQLPVAYQRTLVMPRANFTRLFAAITAVHLATVAGSVHPGGQGALVCDVAGARTGAPALHGLEGCDGAALDAFVREQTALGTLKLNPDPDELVRRLMSPGLKGLVERARVTPPWLWDTGDTLLVYGIAFARPPG
jgi:hypothetical protein